MPARSTLLVAFVWCLFLSGCGSKGSAKVAVTGIVYFRGQPIKGGLIVFTPDLERGSQGPLFKGVIGSDGRFTLSSEESAAVAPGWYRVSIAANGPSVPTAENPYPGPPGKYRNPDLSGLVREVKPGSDNVFEFQLTDS
jgi:hypothetical protein